MMELELAIQRLSKQGISKHNLYKYFLPTKVDQTIAELSLNCTAQDLIKQWLLKKDII